MSGSLRNSNSPILEISLNSIQSSFSSVDFKQCYLHHWIGHIFLRVSTSIFRTLPSRLGNVSTIRPKCHFERTCMPSNTITVADLDVFRTFDSFVSRGQGWKVFSSSSIPEPLCNRVYLSPTLSWRHVIVVRHTR